MHDLLQRRVTPPVHVDVTHSPDCKGHDDDSQGQCKEWCYAHNQCEPFNCEKDYLVCAECLHVFRTESELIRSHLLLMQKLSMDWPYDGTMDDYGRLPKILTLRPCDLAGDNIYSCPHCTHDFP